MKRFKIQLGLELSNKILIYLDMNYWIKLRKCYLEQENNQEYLEFYALLKNLVEQDKVLCPINLGIFSELLKQDDFESRINTSKVIDIFSHSITLIFELEREKLELQYYIREKLLGENNLLPIKIYVWTKISYIMGDVILYNDKIDRNVQNEMQMKFFDHLWSISLEEMIKNYLQDKALPFLDKKEIVETLNYGKFKFQNNITSIDQLFKYELKGGLDVFLDIFNLFFDALNDIPPEIYRLLSTKCKINNSIQLRDKIEDDIIEKQVENYLPKMFIGVCIHTLMRWDKNRKFKPNDIYDFEHARAALPYYDYFFTEAPLKHMVYQKPYELAKRYNCIVENEVKEINKLLNKIIGN